MKIQFPYQHNEVRILVEAEVLPSMLPGSVTIGKVAPVYGAGKIKQLGEITEEDLRNAAVVHMNAFKRIANAIAV